LANGGASGLRNSCCWRARSPACRATSSTSRAACWPFMPAIACRLFPDGRPPGACAASSGIRAARRVGVAHVVERLPQLLDGLVHTAESALRRRRSAAVDPAARLALRIWESRSESLWRPFAPLDCCPLDCCPLCCGTCCGHLAVARSAATGRLLAALLQLLHLLPQLFGFAAQLFLLPAFAGRLLRVALTLFGQFLLAPGQFLELLHGSSTCCWRCCADWFWRAPSYWFFSVSSSRSNRPSRSRVAPPPRPLRHRPAPNATWDIAEGGFGAQQCCSARCSGAGHPAICALEAGRPAPFPRGLLHIVTKLLRRRRFAATAAPSCARPATWLIAQLGLHLREERRVLGFGAFGALSLELVPRSP